MIRISKPTLFLGITISNGKRPFHYAAVSSELRLVALGQGPLDEVVAFAAGQTNALAAIDAPQQPNQGLMGTEEIRRQFVPPPAPRLHNLRLAEYTFRAQGLKVPGTPGSEGPFSNRVQSGFILYEQLRTLGFQPYPTENAPLRYLETQSEAAFWSLLGVVPLEFGTLESRLQRQLVLYLNDMPLPDPLDFFEEVTRHRLLQGNLPVKDIHSADELNALAAAFTAWLADCQPARLKSTGDAREGIIYLPKAIH
jgi:hypothetical protein